MDHSLYYANMQRLKKPKGCRAKATGGEAVVQLLRTFGNTGYEALRLLRFVV